MPDFKNSISINGVAVRPENRPIQRGTAFPGTKANNDLFHRTDLGVLCEWDGSRWLGPTEHLSPGVWALSPPWATATTVRLMPLKGTYFTKNILVTVGPLSPHNATNYWIFNVYADNTNVCQGNTVGITPDTTTTLQITSTITLVVVSYIYLSISKYGNPGNIHISATIEARRVYT